MNNTIYPKLANITPMEDHKLLLEFTNGEKRIYDFKPNLTHKYYRKLTNIAFFNSVSIIDGDIAWSTGQDFCPRTLYEKSIPL